MKAVESPLKRRIGSLDIVKDIRTGMRDRELMHKYNLSVKGLSSAYTKLVRRNDVSHFELSWRSRLYRALVSPERMPTVPRIAFNFPVNIYEAELPESKGVLLDLSEVDLKIAGINAEVDEVKSLIIDAEGRVPVAPIWVKASCAWTRMDPDTSNSVVRFEFLPLSRGISGNFEVSCTLLM